MVSKPGLRHFGMRGRGVPILYLGYNRQQNNALYVELAMLTPEEESWLTDFLLEPGIYNSFALSGELEKRRYAGQAVDAFSHFLRKAQKLPMYELKVADSDQSIEWTGNLAHYDPSIDNHRMVERLVTFFDQKRNQITPTPVAQPEPVVNEVASHGLATSDVLANQTALSLQLMAIADRLEALEKNLSASKTKKKEPVV